MLRLDEVCKSYKGRQVLKNVSLNLEKGASLGIAGESGAGKTTLARLILGLEKPTKGHIYFFNRDVTHQLIKNNREGRGNIQMIFQNPFESLDPRWDLKRIILEDLTAREKVSQKKQDELLEEILSDVGLSPDLLEKRPSQLSGGENQRACIARAIITKPDLIICDEPTSSLDFILKKKILNLFQKIREKYGISLIVIAHDLSLIRSLCDQVMIMRNGEVTEQIQAESLQSSRHPYTRKMLRCIPTNDPKKKIIIQDVDFL